MSNKILAGSVLDSAARGYVDRIVGADLSYLPLPAVIGMIEAQYAGGIEKFVADYTEPLPETRSFWNRPVTPKAGPDLASDAGRRRFVTSLRAVHKNTRRKLVLGNFDVVTKVSDADGCLTVHVQIVKVDVQERRDVVRATGTRLIKITRQGIFSEYDDFTIMDDEPKVADFVRFGSVRTPERVADQDWQYDNCYRPGTEDAPMAGPAARAEVSDQTYWEMTK